MINFVKAWLAFQDYAAAEELTANEVILFMGLFRCFNDHRWPSGALGITNNQLLNHTTFTGSKRDDTMRDARRKLAERGVITFTNGVAYKSRATYIINWDVITGDTPEDAPQDTPEDAPEKRTDCRCESQGYIQENVNQNETINNKPVTDPEEDKHTQSSSISYQSPRAREDESPKQFNPERPTEDDEAWKNSVRVRYAIAQRLVDFHDVKLLRGFVVMDDGVIIKDNDGVDVLAMAMSCNVSPSEINELALGSMEKWEWLTKVRLLALSRGAAPSSEYEMQDIYRQALAQFTGGG